MEFIQLSKKAFGMPLSTDMANKYYAVINVIFFT